MTDRWYALGVRPRFEQFVIESLKDNGHEAFVPTYRIGRAEPDCRKALSLPLFPGYVFSRFDMRYRFSIVSTPAVNFIAPQACAMPVDEFEMDALRRVLESGLRVRPAPYSSLGNPLYVNKGPLRGLMGLGERGDHRDWLLIPVTVLHRSFAVEVDSQWIEPLGASPLRFGEEAVGS